MADATNLNITATQVLPGPGCNQITGIGGAVFTPGEAVYQSQTTGQWWPACSASPAQMGWVSGKAAPLAIALTHCEAAGQSCVVGNGCVILGAGAAPVPGSPYFVSAVTAGTIVQYADIHTAAPAFPGFLGIATAAVLADSTGLPANALVGAMFNSGILAS